jgi:hypothetical protein
MKLENGYYETSNVLGPFDKGTYITNDTKITMTPTHVYGKRFSLDSKWYSKTEMEMALVEKGIFSTEKQRFNIYFSADTYDFSVKGKKLTLTDSDGDTENYTRK